MNDERTSGIKQEGEGRMGNKRNAAGGFGRERERERERGPFALGFYPVVCLYACIKGSGAGIAIFSRQDS
jgi:hypothetical protein